VNDRELRVALDQMAPDVPNDADAVLAEVKPGFRRARRRRRLGVMAALAAAAGAMILVVVLLIGPATTSEPSDPTGPGSVVTTNPPLTTGVPVPFTLDEAERD
jgi:hypothetical protein